MKERLKRLLMWEYGRETSIYVIFCLLIVAFIFATPKSWFDKREKLATNTSRIIVKADVFTTDGEALLSRVRTITGDPSAQVVGTRQRTDENGETVYEIEVR